MPSLWLVGSVLVTVAVCIVLARFIPRFGASGLSIGSAVLANIIVFILVDMGKVLIRGWIGDGDVDVISSSELLEVKVEEESEATKELKKRMRYQVHANAVVKEKDLRHSYVSIETRNIIGKIRAAAISDGFIKKGGGKASFDSRASFHASLITN
jgi:hypothetical protein